MKKIYICLLIFVFSVSVANAQTFSLTKTVNTVFDSIVGFFHDIGNVIGIKSVSDEFKNISDWWGDNSMIIDCDEVKKKAGQYADAWEKQSSEAKDTVGGNDDYTDPNYSNTPITVPDLTYPIDSGINPTTSIPKTNPTINPGLNQPIDNVNTSSTRDLICINIANAKEKNPCDELRRDKKAAEKASKSDKLSDKEKKRAKKAYDNISQALEDCCGINGGGGVGDAIMPPKSPGESPGPTVTIINPPDISVPITQPPIDTKPSEYVYVCDFTSESYNNMYNCIVKQGNYTKDDIQCNFDENKSFKEYETVTKKFLGLIPYETVEEKEMFYNPVCVKLPETPPITEPPTTVPIGNPDKPTPSTPTTSKPNPPAEIDPYCNIRVLQFYDKDTNTVWDQDDTYSIFTKPEDGILSNPKLEYIAENCENCRLEITPTVNEFVYDNSDVFGILKGESMKESNRYLFWRTWDYYDNAISLNINNLKPDKYIISLICSGPGDEGETETLRLNIYPQMRWREVVPVINH